MPDIPFLVFQLVVLIFSVMIHEISHGYAAERLGDSTARLAGRLTLNPLRHLDPVGSIFLPLLLFFLKSPVLLGWAKPVPYNPYNLSKDYKYGPLKVALAGPFSNLLLLLIFGLGARLLVDVLNPILIGLFGFIAFMNTVIAVFNLLPIPPLDGSKILTLLLPANSVFALERLGFGGLIFVFFFLFFFSGIISLLSNILFKLIAGPEVYAAIATLLASF